MTYREVAYLPNLEEVDVIQEELDDSVSIVAVIPNRKTAEYMKHRDNNTLLDETTITMR